MILVHLYTLNTITPISIQEPPLTTQPGMKTLPDISPPLHTAHNSPNHYPGPPNLTIQPVSPNGITLVHIYTLNTITQISIQEPPLTIQPEGTTLPTSVRRCTLHTIAPITIQEPPLTIQPGSTPWLDISPLLHTLCPGCPTILEGKHTRLPTLGAEGGGSIAFHSSSQPAPKKSSSTSSSVLASSVVCLVVTGVERVTRV